MNKYASIVALLWCVLISHVAKAVDAPLIISYNLQKSQRVSLNIYDAKGQIVRELLHGAARIAGNHREKWDGRDDAGKPVAAGQYSWKMLSTPGFGADYITNPGASYPVKNSDPFWAQSPGSHGAPGAVSVDGTGFYVGAAATENIEVALLKQSLDGTSRLWSQGVPSAWIGAVALASTGTDLWECASDGNVFRYDPAAGGVASSGNRYDDTRTFGGAYNNDKPGDMAADDTNIILSYPVAGVVRWMSIASIAKSNATEVRNVSVPGVKAVDVSSDGTVYVIVGSELLKIPLGATAAQPFISGLIAPRRAAVNPKNGDIYIVDMPQYGGGQIKRYNSIGVLQQSYGAPAGRADGLYVKTNFRGVSDIAVDSSGGFWIAEGEAAPRRTAHFRRDGTWVAEWYGGQTWAPCIMPEPDNPRFVWIISQWGEMMRTEVDYTKHTWKVHSCYKYQGLANGLIPPAGIGQVWEAHVRNGVLYLCRLGTPMVIKVDRTNWKLIPASVAFSDINGLNPTIPPWFMKAAGGNRTGLWTDLNGDGLALNADGSMQAGEVTFFNAAPPQMDGFGIDKDLNYVGNYWQTDPNQASPNNAIKKFTVTSWTGQNVPVYGDFPFGTRFSALPPRSTKAGDPRWSPYFIGDSGGNIWGGFNPGIADWGGGNNDVFVARWNPNGTLAWQAGQAGHAPGQMRSLRRAYGVIDNPVGSATDRCLVVGAFAYEWPQEGVTPVYVWDQDGLYVGQILGQPLNTAVANWKYSLGAEGLSGQILKDAGGNVYFYGHWINEGRIFRITGWDGWQRASGTITVPTEYSAPAAIAESIGPNSTGTGLLGKYWIIPDWPYNAVWGQSTPAITRVDPTIDFTWSPDPDTSHSPTGTRGYAIRWTGTLTPRRTGWHMLTDSRDGGQSGYPILVNNVLVSDAYGPGHAIWLKAGQAYPIQVDFASQLRHDIDLMWSEPETNGGMAPIPTSQLNPPSAAPSTPAASNPAK